ncbi:MAG: hypothetical protein ACI9O5_003048, partial [Algoriphagus sp.]
GICSSYGCFDSFYFLLVHGIRFIRMTKLRFLVFYGKPKLHDSSFDV